MKVTKDLTEGNIYRNYLLYVIPLILASLLSCAYSTVDAMIAGKFISEHALGAISATGSFDTVFYSFFNGFGSGFAVYVAHLFGKRDYVRMKRDIVQILMVLSVVIVAISAVSILFRNPIMDYLKVDPVFRADTEIYFVIYTAGYLVTYINLILMQILHALGVTSFSLYVSFASALLNIGGNLLTVLVFDMGVAGLAFSTLFSTAVATVFYLIMLRRAFRELPCEKISFRFSFSCVGRSLRYTLPAATQQVAFHGIGLFIAPAINGIGAAATTGNTVVNRMCNMCAQSFWNTTKAVSCYTAQCMGAEKHEKIRHGLWVGLLMNCAMLLPFVLVFCIFAEPIASLFFPTGYIGEAFDYAVRFAKVYMPFLYINMIGHLIHSYLRGLGIMNVVFGITVFGSLVRLAATLLLVPGMQMEGVYLGQLISWSADAMASVILYFCFYRTSEQIGRAIKRVQTDKRNNRKGNRYRKEENDGRCN